MLEKYFTVLLFEILLGKMEGKVSCSVCQKMLSKSYVKTHEKKFHKEGKSVNVSKTEKVACRFCNKQLSRGYVKKHEKKAHPQKVRE